MYFRFGFHLGPGGNRQGIGDYFNVLTAAGVPAVLKSVDDYGVCGELAAMAANVPHVIVFRMTGVHDTPNYDLPAQDAAAAHWQQTKAALPPEFDKERVWLEVINEPDKNRSGWVGDFMYAIARMARNDGYRIAGPGWSTGEPEPEDWLSEGWRAYFLEVAAGNALLTVHEYSMTDVVTDDGWLIGRFRFAIEAAETMGVPHPRIFISEFGWRHNDMPAVEQAVPQLRSIGVYQVPEVIGAAIWYLGEGYSGLCHKAQQLIAPLADVAVSGDYRICRGMPRVQYPRTYVVLPNNELEALSRFLEMRESRHTAGWSFDDAGIGDLEERLVVFYDQPRQDRALTISWFTQHYPGVNLRFVQGSQHEDVAIPPVVTPCGGTPRHQYARVYYLLHDDLTDGEIGHVFKETFRLKRTIGWSFDDAGIGDLDNRRVRAWGFPLEEREGIVSWYENHYPGVLVEFRDIPSEPTPLPPPPPSAVLVGVHASADPVLADGEVETIGMSRPDVLKVLSNINPADLASLSAAQPGARWIVRAFLSFGGRRITPAQFVQDTIGDVARTCNVLSGKEIWIEIHNEPNLIDEGLGTSWANGREFATWFLEVLAKYKVDLPHDCRFLYPGLSPGGNVVGIRQDSLLFLTDSLPAICAADGLGMHCYWSGNYPMSQSLIYLKSELGFVGDRCPNKPIWVTEASHNGREVPGGQKGREYTQFVQEMGNIAGVRGVTFFVASARNPAFHHEVWVKDGKSTGIAEELAMR